jgi:dUTP pyrophosphatase
MARGFEVVRDDCRRFPNETPIIPERKTAGSMAYDLASLEDYNLLPGEMHHFVTDLKAYMGKNECFIINIRSSIGVKKHCILINTQGWIDSDFYNNVDNDGNIGILLLNTSNAVVNISKGERIAQGAFFNFLVKDNDNASGLRIGGIGSTGVK